MKRIFLPTLLIILACAVAHAAAPANEALFRAIESGNLTEFRAAIDKGADINALDASGMTTPLRMACRLARFDMAQELVERGADMDASGPVGETAFLIAAGKPGSAAFLQYLDRKGANIRASMDVSGSAIECAAASADMRSIQTLVNMGLFDPKGEGAQSARLVDSCFIAAVRGNPHPEVIRFFMDQGADVNARDSEENALAWEGWRMEKAPERLAWLRNNTSLPIAAQAAGAAAPAGTMPEAYQPVIDMYKRAIAEHWEEDWDKLESNGIPVEFGYGGKKPQILISTVDINDDGSPELVVHDAQRTDTLFAAYTLHGGKAVRLFTGAARNKWHLTHDDNGRTLFENEGSSGADNSFNLYYTLHDGALAFVTGVFHDAAAKTDTPPCGPWFMAGGKPDFLRPAYWRGSKTIPEAKANEIINDYEGRRHFPAGTPIDR